ncbi:hypothetical protein [Actinomadura geliboluensis]|uniref:hypothetical protein n=1 Tax=Actinomadura geliboluensis TaxID=882440 RepID=UPI0036BA469A
MTTRTDHANPTTSTGQPTPIVPGHLFARHPRPLPVLLVLVVGWACGTCGGGGVASDGSTCPDCNGHGHTH